MVHSNVVAFHPVAFQAKGVLSLPVSVRLSVRLSVRPWTLPSLCDNSSLIWARITKFAPNMHHGILSDGIENRGPWPWPSRSFWPFWLRILRFFFHVLTCNGFELKSPNLHQMCILRFLWLVLNTGIIDLDLQGHLAISGFQETAFNITLVYWSRLAKGCYMYQCALVVIHYIELEWSLSKLFLSITFKSALSKALSILFQFSNCSWFSV